MYKHSKRTGIPPLNGSCVLYAADRSFSIDVQYHLEEWEEYEPVLNAPEPMTTYAGKRWRGTLKVSNPISLIGVNVDSVLLDLPDGSLKVTVAPTKESLGKGIFEVTEYAGHE